MFRLNAWIIKDLEEYQSCCLSGGSSGIAISRAAVVSQDMVVVSFDTRNTKDCMCL